MMLGPCVYDVFGLLGGGVGVYWMLIVLGLCVALAGGSALSRVWDGFSVGGLVCVMRLCGLWLAGLLHSVGVMCCWCVVLEGVGGGILCVSRWMCMAGYGCMLGVVVSLGCMCMCVTVCCWGCCQMMQLS